VAEKHNLDILEEWTMVIMRLLISIVCLDKHVAVRTVALHRVLWNPSHLMIELSSMIMKINQ